MKKTALILPLLVVSMSLHASVGALPDFLTPEQCAQYNKEHAGVAASPQEPTVFFTGKPYVDGLGYVFKYRNYNPELCRWQSADPSGFPDGANNQIYAPCPTSGVDALGLAWHFVGKNSGNNYSGTFSVPVDIDGTDSGYYSITGFSNGTATSLTLSVSVQTGINGWFQSADAATGSTITLNINPVSGEVTMSGLIQDTAHDSGFTIGQVDSAYNVGIDDGKNVVQGKIAYGNTYASGGGTLKFGFTGAGLEVGIELPLNADWSRLATLDFSIDKAE